MSSTGKDPLITLETLSVATNGFSKENLIGSDGFGDVYTGVLANHGKVVIKLLDPWQRQLGEREFISEVSLLLFCKHENLVSLLGYCCEDGHKILVFEYGSNGTLDKHLSSKDLTWVQRLQICLDAARGLQYLHDDIGPQHRILHRDIKSSNILLDKNWTAKISDFGLSKMDPMIESSFFSISSVYGTIGYIDPDYINTRILTKESDVYSFGVVLFEVLCGRLARVRKYTDERQLLVNLVKMHWKQETLDDIIYSGLHRQINRASLLTFATIAYQCLLSPSERPLMKKVVEQLEKALEKQLEKGGSWWNYTARAAHDPQGQSGLSQESSSSPSWKYDVFISFRGEDTRKTFVDHLFSTLEDRQIFTYKDDEVLPRGETIGPSLFKAIKESRIAIIVFSQNYASSSWCLDEPEFIMKNRDEREQIVIPIFYDVEPSEVRKQTWSYRKALLWHMVSNRNTTKVESWREALTKAGNISGWDPRTVANGHEAKAIKEICDYISQQLLKLMTRAEASAEVSTNIDLIGVETQVQELKSFLKIGSGDVQMVGICGMWGSGKSTLASSLYEKISHEFEGCCFVENIRDRSRMHGLKRLQEKILSNVLKSKVILRSVEHGIFLIERRLYQNSVLIVLDDVDHTDHLKMLAGSKNWFGSGSRIIFTTRNQDLVNAHGAITRYVRMLNDVEAIELLSRHAFGNKVSRRFH